MDNSVYINLSRQSGLLKEMSVIANNIANVSTTGFRRQGAVFSEYVIQAGARATGGAVTDSLKNTVSMGRAGAHFNDFSSGGMEQTGGTYDFAIDGEGFFLIETPAGERLSRAGRFMTNPDGMLITVDGYNVLDEGGAPIQIPPEAGLVTVGGDGSISVDGNPLGNIGVVTAPAEMLARTGSNLWQVREGGQFEPLEAPRILQGFLESSNVKPIIEIARMIEVQRAYEAGQKLLDIEDERIGKTIRTVGQSP
ncbi:MAG: flagellar hook-basal body complex protein [Robiginitomaculum sp.]|nr:flagellar hook-basal body complex protein [Robiginitomaculum sp.]